MSTIKDGAKIALGFMLVKTVAVIGGELALKGLRTLREHLEEKNEKTPAAPVPFQTSNDAPWGVLRSVDLEEMPPWMKEQIRAAIPNFLENLPEDIKAGLRDNDCGNPDCLVHGELNAQNNDVVPDPYWSKD